MKTICPHCMQEYPDTPDDYLGMTFECPVCHQEFVCEKAKFCPECGAIHPAKALKCSQCGKIFLTIPQRQNVYSPVNHQNIHELNHNSKLEENEDKIPWYKRSIFRKKEKIEYESNICGILALLLSIGAWVIPILILPAIIYALFVHASKGQRWLALAVVFAKMITNVVMELSKLGTF